MFRNSKHLYCMLLSPNIFFPPLLLVPTSIFGFSSYFIFCAYVHNKIGGTPKDIMEAGRVIADLERVIMKFAVRLSKLAHYYY